MPAPCLTGRFRRSMPANSVGTGDTGSGVRGTGVKNPPDQVACQGDNVARAGIEPATFRFSGGRSYQLSYLAAGTRTECHT